MTYKVNGTVTKLPLTVESVKDYISRRTQTVDSQIDDLFYRLHLYRDVLICIKLGAAHGKELASKALEMENITYGK